MSFNKVNREIKIVKTKNDVEESESFYQAVGPCLAYGQVNWVKLNVSQK